MSHKRQHAVPESYLRAWLDRNPFKRKRHVWQFKKDGSAPRRQSPRSIFHETDLYTIHRPNGQRDLLLEQGLSRLESAFGALRKKLAGHEPLTTEEHVELCAFIAAQLVRTPIHRDHHAKFWSEVLGQMDDMKEWAKTVTPELRDDIAAASVGGGSRPSFGYEEVKLMAERPMQTMLASFIKAQLPHLVKMDCVVMECSSELGFITSDNPCVWFDPEAHKRPPLYRSPGLGYPSIEITLPVAKPPQRSTTALPST